MTNPAQLDSGERVLDDLSAFLAYHGTVTYHEARERDVPDRSEYPEPVDTGHRADCARKFTLQFGDARFLVTVQEL